MTVTVYDGNEFNATASAEHQEIFHSLYPVEIYGVGLNWLIIAETQHEIDTAIRQIGVIASWHSREVNNKVYMATFS